MKSAYWLVIITNFFQTKYFGLYYINKQAKVRWVELEKPLKKQIDKNSQELTLYFGVLYYVANIDSIEQEITRYGVLVCV